MRVCNGVEQKSVNPGKLGPSGTWKETSERVSLGDLKLLTGGDSRPFYFPPGKIF